MIVPHIYGFLLPLFVGNTAHMLIVKFDLFPYLAVPISTRCFGKGNLPPGRDNRSAYRSCFVRVYDFVVGQGTGHGISVQISQRVIYCTRFGGLPAGTYHSHVGRGQRCDRDGRRIGTGARPGAP